MYHGDRTSLTPAERHERRKAAARKYHRINRAKCSAQSRAWYALNKESQHLLDRIRKRKMTLDEYAALDESQDWVCAICRKEAEMHLDHCHATNKVRGLLCMRCNLGIGHFRDDPDVVLRAATYLQRKAS